MSAGKKKLMLKLPVKFDNNEFTEVIKFHCQVFNFIKFSMNFKNNFLLKINSFSFLSLTGIVTIVH